LLTDRGAPFEERPLASIGIVATESLRTRDAKYVKTRAGDLFYDLRADPLERASRLNEDPAGVAKARAALDETHKACEGWLAAHPARPEAEAGSGNAPAWMINRDEVERKLRSLGYVQ
jgi:hypothetical protein